MNTKRLGDRGEEAAAKFLANKGYKILARQFRTPLGELDLVARDGGTLVFVEVKTRRSLRFGLPSDAVGVTKQRKIIRSSMWYIGAELNNSETPPCRFDVIEIYVPPGGAWHIRHFENAFDACL